MDVGTFIMGYRNRGSRKYRTSKRIRETDCKVLKSYSDWEGKQETIDRSWYTNIKRSESSLKFFKGETCLN